MTPSKQQAVGNQGHYAGGCSLCEDLGTLKGYITSTFYKVRVKQLKGLYGVFSCIRKGKLYPAQVSQSKGLYGRGERMTDKEKERYIVLMALECCKRSDEVQHCKRCPYLRMPLNQCMKALAEGALNIIATERAEAVKEFAERLKEKASKGFWNELAYVDVDDIDNLVEEMVGD